MSIKNQRTLCSYQLGWLHKALGSGRNPFDAHCPEGLAYLNGRDDALQRWDSDIGGKFPPAWAGQFETNIEVRYPPRELQNAHVRLWIRYQHWLAERQSRFLAMLVWSNCYAKEAGNE